MESLYYIGMTQAWFAALLLYRKPGKGAADRLLIIWLLVIGLEMLYSLLNLRWFAFLPDLIIIPLSYGPFLFFYTRLLISRKALNFKIALPHFTPVIVFVVLALLWGRPLDIDAIDFFQKGGLTWIALFNFSFFLASMLFYWQKVLTMIRKHNQTISDHFSFRSDTIMLSWLKTTALWILGGFIGSALLFFIFFTQSIFPFNPIGVFHLGLLLFTFSISYYGIHQPVIFERKPMRVSSTPIALPAEELSRESDFGEKLNKLILAQKPWLNSELTIQDLASMLHVSSSEISTFLNKELGMNFFNYINGYRLEEAKQRLMSPLCQQHTLLAIAFDSGFNSKSSFNSLFKKHTGMTPSEYRKIYS